MPNFKLKRPRPIDDRIACRRRGDVACDFAISNSMVQESTKPPTLERQIYDSFDRGDYAKAIELIDAKLKHAPNDPDMLYNLACANCLLKDFDDAASDLLKAFKAGFRDIEHMRSDPDLSRCAIIPRSSRFWKRPTALLPRRPIQPWNAGETTTVPRTTATKAIRASHQLRRRAG